MDQDWIFHEETAVKHTWGARVVLAKYFIVRKINVMWISDYIRLSLLGI